MAIKFPQYDWENDSALSQFLEDGLAADLVVVEFFADAAPSGVSADVSAIESADTLLSSATVASTGINANLTATEGADTLASSAAIAIQATLGRTEAADTLSSAAVLAIHANANLTEGQDTAAGQAVLPIQAAGSTTETPDTVSASAALAIRANYSQSEGADTVSSTASVGTTPINADLAANEAPDTLGATASLTTGGSGANNRGDDVWRHKKPLIFIRPKLERDLDDILEVIDTVQETERVSVNKRKLRVVAKALKAIEPPPDYTNAIAGISAALDRVTRSTAKHEGLKTALATVSLQLEAVIADMQQRRKRKQRDDEALLWLI